MERIGNAGVAQLVRASAFQAEGREFESRLPLSRTRRERSRHDRPECLRPMASARATEKAIVAARERQRAHVAQLAEHVLGKDGVTGSNPVVGFVLESAREIGVDSEKPEGLTS